MVLLEQECICNKVKMQQQQCGRYPSIMKERHQKKGMTLVEMDCINCISSSETGTSPKTLCDEEGKKGFCFSFKFPCISLT